MSDTPFDFESCRRQFPALQRELSGQRVIYFDGPAGSQVPQRVADALSNYLLHQKFTPGELAELLGARGIFVWHGNYYALPLTETLGLEPEGMVRVGLLHYNSAEEVDRLLAELQRLDQLA